MAAACPGAEAWLYPSPSCWAGRCPPAGPQYPAGWWPAYSAPAPAAGAAEGEGCLCRGRLSSSVRVGVASAAASLEAWWGTPTTCHCRAPPGPASRQGLLAALLRLPCSVKPESHPGRCPPEGWAPDRSCRVHVGTSENDETGLQPQHHQGWCQCLGIPEQLHQAHAGLFEQ